MELDRLCMAYGLPHRGERRKAGHSPELYNLKELEEIAQEKGLELQDAIDDFPHSYWLKRGLTIVGRYQTSTEVAHALKSNHLTLMDALKASVEAAKAKRSTK